MNKDSSEFRSVDSVKFGEHVVGLGPDDGEGF